MDCRDILLYSAIASQMRYLSARHVTASWIAIVLKSLPVWLRSPRPLEKEKLAINRLYSVRVRVIVRAMVDLPVPAIPFNQKILL